MSSSINENYISIEDAALFLNIKPVTLRKWIKDKNVPAQAVEIQTLRTGRMGEKRKERDRI